MSVLVLELIKFDILFLKCIPDQEKINLFGVSNIIWDFILLNNELTCSLFEKFKLDLNFTNTYTSKADSDALKCLKRVNKQIKRKNCNRKSEIKPEIHNRVKTYQLNHENRGLPPEMSNVILQFYSVSKIIFFELIKKCALLFTIFHNLKKQQIFKNS
jgi:hypothetical protein